MSMLSRFASLAASAAPIEYVGGTTAAITGNASSTTNVSLTSLTGGIATSPAANDVVVVYYGTGSTTDRSIGVTTTGYVEAQELYSNDTNDTNLSVSYKVMGASPDTQVTVSATGSTADAGAVVIQVWRNVDQVIPFDVGSTTATGTNSVLCNPPSITPTTVGAVIISGGAGAHTAGVRTFSSSDLSNFASVGSNSSTDVTVGVGSKNWTSGAFNPAAFTFSTADSVSYSWAAVTLALTPVQSSQEPPFAIAEENAQATASSSLVINKPTGTREGDLMIAVMNTGSSGQNWTPASGWTEIADQGSKPGLGISYKVAGPSEGTSYTFTASAAVDVSGSIVTFRNAAYDAIGALSNTVAANILAVSAVTASTRFARVLGVAAADVGSIVVDAPAFMQTLQSDSDATGGAYTFSQDAQPSASGSSGPRSFGVIGAGSVGGALVAIKPAASYTKYAQYITSLTSGDVATSITVNTPPSVPGNLLLFVVTFADPTGGTNGPATPSGWTLLSGETTNGIAYQPGMYVFYRVADGNETATYTASGMTGAATRVVRASIICVAGVNASTLTAGTTNTGSSTTSISANAVTAATNGVLLYFGVQANNGQGVVTFTPPSGMTEASDTSVNASTDISLEIAFQEGLAAGSTGAKTATASAALGVNRFRALLVTVEAK